MVYVLIFVTALLSYLIGSINPAVILTRALYGKDIREEGSGNAGTTNMLRTHGKGMAVLTLIFDILKGIVSVLLAILISKAVPADAGEFVKKYIAPSFCYIGGLFAIIGHNFPVYFSFKGGKGVATSLGVIMFLNWRVGLVVLVMALLIMLATRYVSLGSILAGVIYVAVDVSYMLFAENSFFLPEFLFAAVIALLVIVRHKANIERLKNGTEHKLGEKKDR